MMIRGMIFITALWVFITANIIVMWRMTRKQKFEFGKDLLKAALYGGASAAITSVFILFLVNMF
jgi:uncharacterized membrane protein